MTASMLLDDAPADIDRSPQPWKARWPWISRRPLEVTPDRAGRPEPGVDMDEHTIPLEAGIEDRAISLTKGCYVGQEIIIRVLHRGHGRVAKRLVGMIGLALTDRWRAEPS